VSLLDRQQAFGYTQEDTKILMSPMATTGQEAVGSMGTDTPISALSRQVEAALHLFQAELRAGHQPADRPDPRRAGDEPRLVHRAAPEPARPCRHAPPKRLEVRQPILTNGDLEKIRSIGHTEDVRHQDARLHL
jgi:glutamate synthase (NADPH/NADH) large chain